MRKQLMKTIAGWALLITLLCATQPVKLPAVLLIVPFILLFTCLLQSGLLLAPLLQKLYPDKIHGSGVRHFSVIVSGTVVALMILQSLGQLTLKDAITVLALIAISYPFVRRNYSRHAG